MLRVAWRPAKSSGRVELFTHRSRVGRRVNRLTVTAPGTIDPSVKYPPGRVEVAQHASYRWRIFGDLRVRAVRIAGASMGGASLIQAIGPSFSGELIGVLPC